MLRLRDLIPTTILLFLSSLLPSVPCQPQIPASSFDPYGSQRVPPYSPQQQVGAADGYDQNYGNQMQIHQPHLPPAPMDSQAGSGYPGQQQPKWNQSQHQGQWNSAGEQGVDVRVQLRSYANPLQRVDQSGNMCVCPKIGTSNPNAYQHCIDVNPSRRDTCLVSFMVLVSSDGDPTQYRSTPFIALNSNGQVGAENLHVLQQQLEFHLNGQPGSVDVLVHSLGAVISPYSGDLIQSNTLSHVDSFTKSLNDSTYGPPSAPSLGSFHAGGAYSSGGPQTTLSGSLLGTQLTLSYSVSCRGRLLGPACDLACNSSAINSQTATCVSVKTGYYSLCRWLSGNNQVTDCKSCPWGIRENAYCRDEKGGILDTQHAGVVSEGFRTSTIVLAVVSALLLLCLLGTCVYTCLNHAKRQQSTAANAARSAPGYNSGYRSHTGDAETTALNSSGNLNGALKGGGTTSALMPSAAPRVGSYVPSSLNRPRRTPLLYQLPPPAHLGGTISLNDTLNTSFAGSQAPLAPSVSADV